MSFSKQNLRKSAVFAFFIVAFFCVDRLIKNAVLDGFSYEGSCISFVFVLNDGVAFSWFAFLGTYLKWLQIALLVGVFFYLRYEKLIFRYALPVALIFAGGIANVYDRFVHGGVVDFIYWHCGFDFAIFNFADVIINVGVALLLVSVYMDEKQKKRRKDNL